MVISQGEQPGHECPNDECPHQGIATLNLGPLPDRGGRVSRPRRAAPRTVARRLEPARIRSAGRFHAITDSILGVRDPPVDRTTQGRRKRSGNAEQGPQPDGKPTAARRTTFGNAARDPAIPPRRPRTSSSTDAVASSTAAHPQRLHAASEKQVRRLCRSLFVRTRGRSDGFVLISAGSLLGSGSPSVRTCRRTNHRSEVGQREGRMDGRKGTRVTGSMRSAGVIGRSHSHAGHTTSVPGAA